MTHKAYFAAVALAATLAAPAQAAPQAPAPARPQAAPSTAAVTADGQSISTAMPAQVTFTSNGQQLNDLVGRGVAVADFNGDGALDAFVVNESGPASQECRVYLGDGRGRFEDTAQRLMSRSWARRPVVHDLDGNGTKDVIVGRMAWVNDGRGTFVAGASPLADSDGAMVWQCRLADLNADGRTDLFAIVAAANMETKGRVYLNDGRGRFQEAGQSALPGIAASVELGDVNGDGTTDAVVSGWRNAATDGCPNRVLINDGNGRFTDTGQQLDEEMRHSHGLALGDLDRDGDADLVLVTQGSPSARLYLNDGKGRFTAGRTLGTSGVEKVGLADFDGDGSPDLFLACIGPDEVWLNDGRGGFTDASLRLGKDWSWEIAFGDFNRDGLPDVFVVNLGVDRAAPPETMMKPRLTEVWLNTSRRPMGIHEAARAGKLAAVQEMVAKDPELAGAKDEAGRTALHLASGGGHVDVVAYLFSRNAEVDATDNILATALHLAAAAGHDDIARLLIEKKADVNARDAEGETPLSKACVRGRVAVAGRLLAADASLETPNGYGRTPLILVARESGNAEVARLLLDRKADVAVRDKFGDTALTLAAWRGFRPVVDLLLERGAAIPSEPRARGQLLRQAAQGALDSLFARLLDLGVIRPHDSAGTRSLLHDAAAGGSVRILERLVATTPNVNQADGDGWTPLHDAAFMDRRDAVRFLLDKGADPNVRNLLGQSPWNLAVEHTRDSVADLLAARGAERGAPQFPALSGDYLGQKAPGRVPEVFAPGIVGGHFQLHSSIAFSPDGSEAYWSEMVPRTTPGYGTNRTMTSRRVEGRWRYPHAAMLGSTPLDDVPLVSADGTRIYDMSRRPLPGETGSSPKENIWVADRAGAGWGEPKPLDQTVNALPQHWQFAVDTAGGVYFSSHWKGAKGLFHSRLVNGRHGEPVRLGAPVNATGGEAMPFIARDGSYLLFSRDMDLWVSFRGPDGHWKAPVALPPPINTPDMEICPVVSPDGRYLFFLRGELYWVDAGIIEDLRKTAEAVPSYR